MAFWRQSNQWEFAVYLEVDWNTWVCGRGTTLLLIYFPSLFEVGAKDTKTQTLSRPPCELCLC